MSSAPLLGYLELKYSEEFCPIHLLSCIVPLIYFLLQMCYAHPHLEITLCSLILHILHFLLLGDSLHGVYFQLAKRELLQPSVVLALEESRLLVELSGQNQLPPRFDNSSENLLTFSVPAETMKDAFNFLDCLEFKYFLPVCDVLGQGLLLPAPNHDSHPVL